MDRNRYEPEYAGMQTRERYFSISTSCLTLTPVVDSKSQSLAALVNKMMGLTHCSQLRNWCSVVCLICACKRLVIHGLYYHLIFSALFARAVSMQGRKVNPKFSIRTRFSGNLEAIVLFYLRTLCRFVTKVNCIFVLHLRSQKSSPQHLLVGLQLIQISSHQFPTEYGSSSCSSFEIARLNEKMLLFCSVFAFNVEIHLVPGVATNCPSLC